VRNRTCGIPSPVEEAGFEPSASEGNKDYVSSGDIFGPSTHWWRKPLLKRGFLGWLRGERGHCTMARVPTIAEEDAKRPNRERECLVGERTRIVNRIKATLARLGICNFKPTLRKAAERLATVHTPEGMPLPPNALAELQRDTARLSFVVSQIREIEEARQKRLEQQPETGPHAMVRLLARIVGVGVETAVCWSTRCCHGQCVRPAG
jgi:hypothetical protein